METKTTTPHSALQNLEAEVTLYASYADMLTAQVKLMKQANNLLAGNLKKKLSQAEIPDGEKIALEQIAENALAAIKSCLSPLIPLIAETGNSLNLISTSVSTPGSGVFANKPTPSIHADGNPVNKPSSFIHADGNPINKPTPFIHADGSPVNKSTSPIHGDGSPVNKPSPFIHADGSFINQNPNEKPATPLLREQINGEKFRKLLYAELRTRFNRRIGGNFGKHLLLLYNNPGLTRGELRTQLKVSLPGMDKRMPILLKKGLIKRVKWEYFLTDKSRNMLLSSLNPEGTRQTDRYWK